MSVVRPAQAANNNYPYSYISSSHIYSLDDYYQLSVIPQPLRKQFKKRLKDAFKSSKISQKLRNNSNFNTKLANTERQAVVLEGKIREHQHNNGKIGWGVARVKLSTDILQDMRHDARNLMVYGLTVEAAKELYNANLKYRAMKRRSGETLDSCEPVPIKPGDSSQIYYIYDSEKCTDLSESY